MYYSCDLVHPVGSLLEGIWNSFTDKARFITRSRIYTDRALSSLSEGMLKVVGKRATVLISEEFQELLGSYSSLERVEVRLGECELVRPSFEILKKMYSADEAMLVAKELSLQSKLGIGAVLLNRDCEIVSWGWNAHTENKTLHAEVMLVKNYLSIFKEKIPEGFTLISTLQPCAMCAGFLHANCEDFLKLKIIWKENDPGPMAQNSILVQGSDLWQKMKRSELF